MGGQINGAKGGQITAWIQFDGIQSPVYPITGGSNGIFANYLREWSTSKCTLFSSRETQVLVFQSLMELMNSPKAVLLQ